MERDFDYYYEKLNPEQKRAVDAIDGPVMVIAGPGTGKTQVLTMRIANILKKTDASPDSILALTFTESGVASMRKRLAELIGPTAYRVSITTFHSFANEIIKNNPDKFPNIIGSTNVSDVDQIRIATKAIDEADIVDLRPFGDRYLYLRSLVSAIAELKRQGVTPEKLVELVEKEQGKFDSIDDLIYESGAHKGKMRGKYVDMKKHIDRNREVAKVYAKYQELLRAAKLYDWSDMIMEVAGALQKDADLLLSLQEEYQYILVDEHQDTNTAQNRILELMANYDPRPNIFVVGDEKQAIFRFQGASLENFLYFKDLYKDVELINLQNNYRSTQTILDIAQNLAPDKSGLKANAGHAEKPLKLCTMPNPRVEQFYVGTRIKELLDSGVHAEEIAVLYRENRDAAPMARMLEKLGIPLVIESDQDLFGDEDIKKLLTIMKAVQNYGSGPELAELLHVDLFGISPLDIYKFLGYGAKERVNLYDVMRSEHALKDAKIESVDAFLSLFDRLSKWKSMAKNKTTATAFEAIVRESDLLASILANPAVDDKLQKLHVLFDQVKTLVESHKDYTLENFFEYLDVVREHNVLIKKSGGGHPVGRVRLMTAHKSKGLEFEYVFIVNAVDGHWGGRRRHEHIKLPKSVFALSDVPDDVEESEDDSDERNLFYVALTRAKKELCVTLYEFNTEGRECLPSQFIQEIRPELIEVIDPKPFANSYAENREIEFSPSKVTVSEMDKAYLNQLFIGQGLSVTALNNYLECPWTYFYRNLVRIPEAPNKHLMFGLAVHDALRSFFEQPEDPGKEYLINRFKNALARQPIQDMEYREALEKGEKALSGFFDANAPLWNRNSLVEERISGIELAPDLRVNGAIDRMELLDMAGHVKVIDYKTGKPKSRNVIEGLTKSSDGNYKRQLVFYRLLLDRFAEGKYRMQLGEIQFVEPDDKGKYHKEAFEIGEDEVQKLEELIKTVAKEIMDLSFWDKTCDQPDCQYCDLRRMSVKPVFEPGYFIKGSSPV